MRLLILAKERSSPGGVVNFVNMLESRLGNDIRVDRFRIGQRSGQTGKLIRWLVPFADMLRLIGGLSRTRYDVVHVNPSLNGRSMFRDALFMLALKMRGPDGIVLFIHGWEEDTAMRINKNRMLRKSFGYFFGYAPVIYVLASRFRDSLVEWGVDAERIHVITTMFDGGQFDGITRNRSDNEIRLLFLSRFVKEKGIYELLNSFMNLHSQYPHLRLIFAGEGPEETAMRSQVRDAGLQDVVSFAGYVRGKDKAQALVDADIFVFPTYYGEGCPVSLLEAMAAGLPVVTANAGGIGDFIVDGKNGRLLDKVTDQSVEAALQEFLVNEERRVETGELNKVMAWERFEAGIISADIEKMYHRLADSR